MTIGQIIFLSIIISILLFPLQFVSAAWGKRIIRWDLNRRNHKLIDIVWDGPFGSNPDKFMVTYLTPENKLLLERCRIYGFLLPHWSGPKLVQQLSPEEREVMVYRRTLQDGGRFYRVKSKKEKVIEGLTSTYKFERVWTIRQIKGSNYIDQRIFQMLKEISLDDPEPEVREAALETLHQLERLQ